ncbi:phage infection protein [Lacticaseibacillus absianus]|uniref:phage infection protein n=1 Tax=Lacticaseibacillus absianus TaxID=2729623 RepID=UPI0015CEB992|nr:phage infection protein [Lacticaseibacillus absianus]
MKVIFDTDDEGYITGYQQAFWDGEQWQTPFDTTDAVDLAQIEVDKIVLGASKLVNGAIMVDQVKLAEIAEADKPQPTAEEEIAQLKADNATMQSALMELSDFTFSSMAGGNS